MLAAALVILGSRLALPSGTVAQPGTSQAHNDCSESPGVQLLVDLYRGVPRVNALDLVLPAGWIPFLDAETGLNFTYPPNWTLQRLWADRLTSQGAPVWTGSRPIMPVVTSVRAVSPATDALFENAIAVLPIVPVAPEQAAALARLGITSDVATPICTLQPPNAFTFSWFDASNVGEFTIVTLGVITTSPGPFAPGSAIVWYSLVAPQVAFESHVRDEFARILAALIPGPEVEPTPTPTPG
jgi:hypothetical protein